MNSLEWRATFALGAVYALRMVGMFMILPVFALYARDLPGGASEVQVALAFGVYGLIQALLQIPLGMASDRWGRKPVIVIGMLLFALGSLIAGSTQDIRWIILGRAVQGLGAVSSAVSALLADVTRSEVRTTAMAILGAGMGLAFILALVLGPVVAGVVGVSGIFYLTALLALLAIPVVGWGVPAPPPPGQVNSGFRQVIGDGQLLRLDGGIFLLHAMLTGLFVAAPYAIEQTLGWPGAEHWKLYLPVLVLSIIPVFPLIRSAEQSGRFKPVFLGAIGLLGGALLLAALTYHSAVGLTLALLLFFTAFNFLEGSLPSLISRRAPPDRRGAALGVYSSAQFLGPMLGSGLAEISKEHWGLAGAFACASLLPLFWLSFAFRLAPPSAAATTSTSV